MKRIFALILALTTLAALPFVASAAEVEEDLEYISDQKDIVFWVAWDVKKPVIVFISPDGTEFDPMVMADETETIIKGNAMYYVVRAAERGQWRVRYDKGSNKEISVSVHDYNGGLYIKSFNIGEVTENSLKTEFLVGAAEERVRYRYKISAMIDRTGGEKLLDNGYAYTDEEASLTLDLKGLSTYSAYVLKLYVWYSVNDTDVYDFAFSEEFSYTNTDVDSAEFDYHITVLPEEQLVFVDWEELPRGSDSVLLAVFEDGGEEPAAFDQYELPIFEALQLSYGPEAKKITVEMSVCMNGVNTAPVSKTVTLGDFGLSIPVEAAVNTINLPLNYKGFSGETVSVTVNGYVTETVLNGDGALSVTVGDGSNEIAAEYAADNNVSWKIAKTVFVDRIAPVLSMNRSYDGMTAVDDLFTVSGTALDCKTVTVNGNEAPLDADGYFTYDLKLLPGSNVITVVALDPLGNEARYTAAVKYATAEVETAESGYDRVANAGTDTLIDKLLDENSYWVLGAAGVLSLLIVVYVIIFWRKKATDNGKKGGGKE